MNYEQLYEEARERARKLQENSNGMILKKWLWAIFPELKEDEDERLRKELTEFLKKASGGFLDTSTQCKTFGKWLAWLEKQGNKEEPQAHETESDEVITNSEGEEYEVVIDPRFHKGEWIASEESVWQVDEVRTENYLLISGDEGILFAEEIAKIDSEFHLWTIKDAKDGDILASVDDDERHPFIYKGCLDPNHPDSPVAYCGIDSKGDFCVGGKKFNNWWTDVKVCPATKEQCDFLFQKMKEAGYEWDSENKVLNKIVQKSIKEEAEKVLSDNASQNEENTTTVRLQRIIDFLWKNRKGDTDTIFQQEQDIAWLKSLKQRLGK